MKKLLLPAVAVSASVLFFACKKTTSTNPPLSPSEQAQVVENYANILEAGYTDAYNAALNLQDKINDFLANPDSLGFEAAKTAWLQAREPYMQTEAARFYGGPIDGDDGDGLLNSWPLDEGYIDYLVADPHGETAYPTPDDSYGIINKPLDFPLINDSMLRADNQPDGGTTNVNGDPVDVSCGYHAIEFLLWGQDDTPAQDNLPGQRSFRDYLTDGSGTHANQARRALYLQTVTQLLVENLQSMKDAWASGQSNYRQSFVADPGTGIANMFNGIGRLAKGELSGERMFVPLNLHSQEQEHSCFSDNTHRDLYLDMQGIVNVYYGQYVRSNGDTIRGLGLTDFVKAQSPSDDTQMKALLATAQQKLQVIEDNKPFDWLIDGSNLTGNQIVQDGINAVSAVADGVSQIAHNLNLSNVSVPEEND